MHEHLLVGGEGTPVVVSDAQRGWHAPSLWTFEWFEKHYGDSELIANDLAPLRAERTLLLPSSSSASLVVLPLVA